MFYKTRLFNRLALWVVLLAVVGAGTLLPARAAGGASLTGIHAGCETFSLTATFRGTVDEGEGLDYVQLRVIDAAGQVVYTAEPWHAVYATTETLFFVAGYAQTPVAGPLLFVLEDYVDLENRRLQSLASQLVLPDCDTFPRDAPPVITTTCATRLRTGPGQNYRYREFLLEGTGLTVLGRLFDSSWLQVRVDENARLGWVYNGRCLPGAVEDYRTVPVTFFRSPEEMILYQAQVPYDILP